MPPSPPMMAHLLSLGTQSKDAAQALKTEWSVRVCVCVSQTEKEVLSLTIQSVSAYVSVSFGWSQVNPASSRHLRVCLSAV